MRFALPWMAGAVVLVVLPVLAAAGALAAYPPRTLVAPTTWAD